jgi:hypothetical protein
LDKQYRVIDKQLADLQLKSRLAQDEEDKKIFELSTRKKTVLKLLEESRQRGLYHFEQSKKLSLL